MPATCVCWKNWAGNSDWNTDNAAPLAKSELMSALFAAVTADGKVKIAEAELMRLAGAVLGCPLPPLLEEVEPAA